MNKIKKKRLITIILIALLAISVLFAKMLTSSGLYDYFKLDSVNGLFSGSYMYLTMNNAINDNYENESQKYFNVLNYDMDVNLYPADKYIKAKVKILGVADSSVNNVMFNFSDNLIVDSVKFNDYSIRFNFTSDHIVLPDVNLGKGDSASFTFYYKGKPDSYGFGSFEFEKYKEYHTVNTLNEPVFASTWFPGDDQPYDKSTMKISITADSGMVSLSNGKLVEADTLSNRWRYVWETKYPISTYLIALYSGPYESWSEYYYSDDGDKLLLSYYVYKGKLEKGKRDFKIHKTALKIYEELFGKYPFYDDKYAVAEFQWKMGAMEHQTITGMSTNFIDGHEHYTDILIHELAHHWWGNSVGPKTWKDIWLNEGFATYSEALFYEKFYNNEGVLESTVDDYISNYNVGTLYNPGNLMFSRLVYDKGAYVLHMLRKTVGDDIFFKILRNYYQTYKYNSASTNDFKNICEEMSDMDLKYFFDQWVYEGEGIINADVQYSIPNEDGELFVKVTQDNDGYDFYRFPLDISINYSDSSTKDTTVFVDAKQDEFRFKENKKVKNIEVNKRNWILGDFNLKLSTGTAVH